MKLQTFEKRGKKKVYFKKRKDDGNKKVKGIKEGTIAKIRPFVITQQRLLKRSRLNRLREVCV